MPVSLAPTFKPLPLVRTMTVPANTIHNAFSSYSPSCSAFSNRNNVRLRNRRKSPVFGTLIKCGAGGGVLEIDETQFSDVVLKSERPVLVEFVATWCGPCRLIAPAVQLLAKEYEDKLRVVKVDHDSNPGLIEEYKVYGLPTLIIFQNGKEVSGSRREGAITKDKLRDYINKHMETVSIV